MKLKRRSKKWHQEKKHKTAVLQTKNEDCELVDYRVTMLIAAGVAEADIRKAVEIGQFVKDKPAAIMKEAADVLTGTHLSDPNASEGCPADALNQPATAACGCN